MLNGDGFQRPTYDDLVDQLTDKWHSLFGEDANTASNSVGGIFIRLIAYFLSKVYELAEAVYQSQFMDSASGPTLDQLAANLGLVRRAAQTAIGSIKVYGVAGYVVPNGTMFQTDDGLIYVTSEDITLTDTGKTSIDMTADGLGTLSYNNQKLGIGESKLLYANGGGAKYNKPSDYDKYKTIQVTPVEEVLAVQVGDITGGADFESDDQLRARLEQSSTEAPSSPYNGVITAVSNVNGVNAVKIVANDSMVKDAAGNPPKTLHLYVDGGTDEDVGNSIFDSVAAGVQTYGGIKVVVKDIGGSSHNVYYDKPTSLAVFAHIKVTSDDAYPADGAQQIKDVVNNYVQSVQMGATVHYTYLYRAIYDQVPGVVVADVQIGTDASKLAPGDIVLTDIQRATTTPDSVVVE